MVAKKIEAMRKLNMKEDPLKDQYGVNKRDQIGKVFQIYWERVVQYYLVVGMSGIVWDD